MYKYNFISSCIVYDYRILTTEIELFKVISTDINHQECILSVSCCLEYSRIKHFNIQFSDIIAYFNISRVKETKFKFSSLMDLLNLDLRLNNGY